MKRSHLVEWLLPRLIMTLLVVALPCRAGAEELSADQIAARLVRGSGFTWEGAQTRLRMVLVDEKGQRSERSLEVVGRRRDGLLESKVKFLSPSDVAGTKFLMLEKSGGGTEQHVYLPGLKRTRRIVGREREGSFMGSDFTYDDLQRKDDKGTKHVRLPDDKVGSEPTYVLESTPGSPETMGYSKLVTWVRKTDFVPLRTRFYDLGGKLKKTLYVRHTRQVEGKVTVDEARMQSENGHATEIVVDALDRKENIPDAEFSPASLDR